MIFFTSDTHFGHKNIIAYSGRPFETVEEMNLKLIHNWNERVKPEDTIYSLGDFLFHASEKASYRGEGSPTKFIDFKKVLNGNLVLVQGNHDWKNNVPSHINSIVLYISKMYVNLIHNPNKVDGQYELNICGDIHNAWRVKVKTHQVIKDCLCINCGVDVWNFRPVHWDELFKIYTHWKQGKNVEKIYNKEII